LIGNRSGKELLCKNLSRVDNSTLEQYPEFLNFKNRSGPTDQTEMVASQSNSETPDEALRGALRDIEDALREGALGAHSRGIASLL